MKEKAVLPECTSFQGTGAAQNCYELQNSNGIISIQPPSSPPTDKKSKFSGGDEAEKKHKIWLRGEVVFLGVVIFIVWGLFSLPIVFYQIKIPMDDDNSTNCISVSNINTSMSLNSSMIPTISNNTQDMDHMCMSVVSYDGSVCRRELELLTRCLPGVEQDGTIRVQNDQSFLVTQLLAALDSPLLGASDECKAAVRPFLCVYFFGLCDNTGRAYLPSSSQCMEISTGVCAREWSLASRFIDLPDCSSFPDDTTLTQLCDSHPDDGGSGAEGSAMTTQQTSASLNKTCECDDGFYCPDSSQSLCLPECGTWKQYPHMTAVASDVVVIIAAVIGVVSTILLLVIVGFRWKKVFVFPSALIIYQTISPLIMAIMVLVTYIDRTGLYCTSQDLVKSLLSATPFCVISGMVFYYTLFQLAMFWLIHTVVLFLIVRFPFHARRMKSVQWMRYVHVGTVIACILLPLLPIIVAVTDAKLDKFGLSASDSRSVGLAGFGSLRFPPILCAGVDKDATYYSLVLPLNIALTFGVSILVCIFWIIHKQQGLFKSRQSKLNPLKIGTAERKILIVFCYFVLLAVIALLTFTLTTRGSELFARRVVDYFCCASDPDRSCSREGFESLTYPILTSMSYALLGVYPLVNLTFVVSVGEIKDKFSKFCQCHKPTPNVSADHPSSSGMSTGSGKRDYDNKHSIE